MLSSKYLASTRLLHRGELSTWNMISSICVNGCPVLVREFPIMWRRSQPLRHCNSYELVKRKEHVRSQQLEIVALHESNAQLEQDKEMDIILKEVNWHSCQI